MRYLALAEALVVTEVVTGLDPATLTTSTRLDLLDSALHAPQAGFGEDDFYPSLAEKNGVLAVRVARNHALIDGNKRLAWQRLTLFLALNDHELVVATEEAVAFVLSVAAGETDEAAATHWIASRVQPSETAARHAP